MAKDKKPEDFRSEFEAWMERAFGGGTAAASEFKRNTAAFFGGVAERFDLVSRKEFDAQRKALQQAMKKLEELEKRVGKPAKAARGAKASAKKAAKPAAKKKPAKKAKKP